MAVLISPSNNTGWGLGVKSMYGGARLFSDNHPVRVRRHYRAVWGANKRGRVWMPRTANPVADVLHAYEATMRRQAGAAPAAAVVAAAPRRRGRRSRPGGAARVVPYVRPRRSLRRRLTLSQAAQVLSRARRRRRRR